MTTGDRNVPDNGRRPPRKLVTRPDPEDRIKRAILREGTTPEELAELSGRPLAWAARILEVRNLARQGRGDVRQRTDLGPLPRPIRPDPPPGGRGPVGRNG